MTDFSCLSVCNQSARAAAKKNDKQFDFLDLFFQSLFNFIKKKTKSKKLYCICFRRFLIETNLSNALNLYDDDTKTDS